MLPHPGLHSHICSQCVALLCTGLPCCGCSRVMCLAVGQCQLLLLNLPQFLAQCKDLMSARTVLLPMVKYEHALPTPAKGPRWKSNYHVKCSFLHQVTQLSLPNTGRRASSRQKAALLTSRCHSTASLASLTIFCDAQVLQERYWKNERKCNDYTLPKTNSSIPCCTGSCAGGTDVPSDNSRTQGTSRVDA